MRRDQSQLFLDFRVVSEALFVYDDAGRKTRYRVGGYFSAAQADARGAFRRVARGAPCVKHGFPHSDEERSSSRDGSFFPFLSGTR